MARNYCVRGGGGGKKRETKSVRHVVCTTPFSGLPPTTRTHNGIWSVLKFVYVQYTHFGVEDGTVLFPVQIHIICTYTSGRYLPY
jgi:hypothetical protein